MTDTFGWRWWAVADDDVLLSPVDRVPWSETVFRATVCAIQPHHVPPIRGCTCGVYAFTTEADTRAHIRATQTLARIAPSLRARGIISEDQPVVLGRVVMSDDVFVAKRPPESAAVEFKASAARITRLFCSDRVLADRLAVRYGVPVHTS